MSGIPSKKRDIGQINGDNQRSNDQNALFGNERRGDLQGYNQQEDQDEALEDDNLYNQDEEEGKGSDVEPEGDDLMENMEDDYRAVPELDNYDDVGIDDQIVDELSAEGRAEVERRLEQEERLRANMQGRRPNALHDNEDDEEDELVAQQIRQERLRMMREGLGGNDGGNGDDGDDGDGIANALDFEDVRGPLFIWLKKPDVIKFVNRQFDQFLRRFQNDEGHYLYEEKIHEMCQNNKQSLEIVFNNLSQKFPTLAIWLAEEPRLMLDIINTVASDVVSEVYPDYYKIHDKIYIRVKDLPVEDKLRDLRQVHLNALIKIRGVVTKRTQVFPELKEMYYRCQNCQDLKGPLYNNSADDQKQFLGQCIICQKNGPYQLEDHKSVYRNYQKWTIQETPGSVPPGRVPRSKEVFILNDLVDTARPGDEVEITGIFINKFDYGANIKHGFPVFQTIIEANNVRRFGDEDIVEITDEDKAEIKRLSKQSNIDRLIFDSIAPSIYGHDFIKKGLILAMFGGVPKDIGGKHRIRGDINMLLLGDPGTAKSQFLKYVEQVSPRVVYTTGKGASAVGLTAGVHKDPVSQEWVLEAGALVLADKGICLIDEFDKMNDQDRTSIHEAMEQQSISISKAGIVTSLQARCSVIAAANPIKGVYNISMNFNDNVELTDPILSRFDVLAVVKDEVDEEYDDALASFVINSHMKNHPEIMKMFQRTENEGLDPAEKEQQVQDINQQIALTALPNNRYAQNETNIIPQEMLKKYLIYSKKYMKPKLNEIDQDKITQFYADIRKESSVVGGIPIAVRHIESVIRMSEAKAKISLRDHVSTDDIDFAIDMLLQSFLQSQKFSVSRQLSKKFEKYRYRQTDKSPLLLHILKNTVKERALYTKAMEGIDELEKIKVSFKKNLFEDNCREYARHNLTDFYNSIQFRKDFVMEGDMISSKDKY